VASLVAGIAAATTMIAASAAWVGLGGKQFSGIEVQFLRDIDTLQKKLVQQQIEVGQVYAQLQSITTTSNRTPTEVQMAAIRGEIANVGKRISGLEGAIRDSPTKALAVPLLRQDFENLKTVNQKDLESVTKQIDRVYDQNKWFIGLMFSMALGLIGLAISNFMQARKKTE
jgi:hypothetical protein